MRPFLRLPEVILRASDYHIMAMLNETPYTVFQRQHLRTAMHQSNAINGKARLQSRHLKQFVEHHIGISISFHVNHNAQSLAVALVVHV